MAIFLGLCTWQTAAFYHFPARRLLHTKKKMAMRVLYAMCTMSKQPHGISFNCFLIQGYVTSTQGTVSLLCTGGQTYDTQALSTQQTEEVICRSLFYIRYSSIQSPLLISCIKC